MKNIVKNIAHKSSKTSKLAKNDDQPIDVRSTLLDKCFKDRQGKVVLGQPPNKWIVLWLITTTLAFAAAYVSTKLSNEIAFLSGLFLFIWAELEFTKGINYYRRFLGGFTLICIGAVALTLIRLHNKT
jgi:hypothetical protein